MGSQEVEFVAVRAARACEKGLTKNSQIDSSTKPLDNLPNVLNDACSHRCVSRDASSNLTFG